MDVWKNDDLRRVNTHLSYNMGDEFLVAAFLNVIYLVLTGGTAESNCGNNEGLSESSKNCLGIVFVPRSGLAMMMMLSMLFSLSTGMESSFVLSVMK